MKRLFPVFLLLLSLSGLLSCSATNRLSMTVKEPAAVSLPDKVQRIGLINRSVPEEGKAGLAKIDAILSAEGLKLDEEGAQAAITGLADRLRTSGRFEAVVILDSLPEVAKGLMGMPAPLGREALRKICGTYGLDAIFALSYFDTATRVHAELGMMELPNELGLRVKVPAHRLELRTAIRSGWRMYSPKVPLPLDQFEYEDFIVVRGEGINPMEALNSIPYRKERVLERSAETGFFYGGRLEPSRVRVGREYFVRGSEAFKRGRRLAQTGAWDAAGRLWETELTHPKAKVAGRARYNMAIINEINGNLGEALDWAREAYADYGTRRALEYLRILEYRLSRQQALREQLSGLDW